MSFTTAIITIELEVEVTSTGEDDPIEATRCRMVKGYANGVWAMSEWVPIGIELAGLIEEHKADEAQDALNDEAGCAVDDMADALYERSREGF